MTVFKGYMTLVKRNMGIGIMYFGIFVSIAVAMIFVNTGSSDEYYEPVSLDITIIDKDGGKLAEGLKKYMDSYHTLVELPDDKTALQDALFTRETYYIITLPENFEEEVMSGNIKLDVSKVPDSTSGMYVDQQVDAYLNGVKTLYSSGYSVDKAISMTSESLKAEADVELFDSQEIAAHVPNYSFFFQYFPYLAIALLCFIAGEILIRFRTRELKLRLLCSPISGKRQNVQIFAGFCLIGFITWAICIVIAAIIYKGDFISSSNLIFYLINSLLMIIVSMALAFFVGVAVNKSELLTPVANVLSLGMCFLCGVFVPVDMLGNSVQNVAKFLPVYWYELANNLLANKHSLTGENLTKLFQYFGIQIAFAVALLAGALIVSRLKEQRN